MRSTDLPLSALCERFQLGQPIAQPLLIASGTPHHVWHITTTQGNFAVKQLDPSIARQPGIRSRYRLTERIAAAMVVKGIPTITALTRAGWPVQTLNGMSMLVYPWVEGASLPPNPADPAQARLIGTCLGQMHALHLDILGLELPIWRILRDDDWVILARRGTEQRLPWAEKLRNMLQDVRWWNALAQAANKRLWDRFVVSHGDLNQHHLLWQDASTFTILHWDGAGLINPDVDLVNIALAWSGLVVGEPNEASFRAVIEGYRSAGHAAPESADDTLSGWRGKWLEKLEANLRRSLHQNDASAEQASAAALHNLEMLQTFSDNTGLLAAWMAT